MRPGAGRRRGLGRVGSSRMAFDARAAEREDSGQRGNGPAGFRVRSPARRLAGLLEELEWHGHKEDCRWARSGPRCYLESVPQRCLWSFCMRMRAGCVLSLLLFVALLPAQAQQKPWPVRAVIVTTFEVGADTGDEPGEVPVLG